MTIDREACSNRGQIDFGEKGGGGVSIQPHGTDDLGNTVDLTTRSDGTGMYEFGRLRQGSYTITETQPAGFKQGINSVGTVNGAVNGRVAGIDQFFIELAKG